VLQGAVPISGLPWAAQPPVNLTLNINTGDWRPEDREQDILEAAAAGIINRKRKS
jgi:hypothetical protein